MYRCAVSSVGQEIEVACLCFSSKCPLLVELERVKNEMIYLGQAAQEAEERETPPREWGGGCVFLWGSSKPDSAPPAQNAFICRVFLSLPSGGRVSWKAAGCEPTEGQGKLAGADSQALRIVPEPAACQKRTFTGQIKKNVNQLFIEV